MGWTAIACGLLMCLLQVLQPPAADGWRPLSGTDRYPLLVASTAVNLTLPTLAGSVLFVEPDGVSRPRFPTYDASRDSIASTATSTARGFRLRSSHGEDKSSQ